MKFECRCGRKLNDVDELSGYNRELRDRDGGRPAVSDRNFKL